MEPSKRDKKSGFFYNVILSLSVFVFSIFFLEAALALVSHFFYPKLTRVDSELGWMYKSTNGKTIKRVYSKDIIYGIKTNALGFRDSEFSKKDRDLKIMVLGDSMTFGYQENQENIFTEVLERRLEATFKTDKIDIMNFGVTGFST